MKAKDARRALLMSAISLLLCVSMLVGTTFAWFTDAVTSGRNTIAAGILDVSLEYWNGSSFTPVTSGTRLFNDDALWEPGYTEVAYLKIGNAGNLALRYQLNVNVYGEEVLGKTKTGADIRLSEHLVSKVVAIDEAAVGTYTRSSAMAAAGSEKGLTAYSTEYTALENNGDAHYVAMIIYMPDSVGNEANHDGTNIPSIQMGVSLVATQLPYEFDSFDDQYDKGAADPSPLPPVPANFITDALKDDAGEKLNITNIIFGKLSDYPEITGNYEALSTENGVSAYRVEENGAYTVYYLSENKIALPADSTSLFYNLTSMTTFDGTNLDMSQVTNATYMFRECTSLTKIEGAEDWDTSNLTSAKAMFYNCSKLDGLDVSGWDVSNIENGGWMFYNCASVTELDVANWDTSSMNFSKSMFYNNTKLTELNVANWDMSDVTDASYMFSYCTSLDNIDFSNWDVSNVQYFNNMFKHARAMTTLDLSSWDTSSAVDMNHMFANCGSLVNLDISGFDTSKVTTMAWMFYEVEAEKIYVGDKWSLASIANLDEGVYSHKIATAKLVGGQGTTCQQIMNLDSKCVAENGARINATARYMIADGGTTNPGLLTYKAG